MVLNQIDPIPIPDHDDTIYTATTPPEVLTPDVLDDLDPLGGNKLASSTVPWPGSTFIIRDVSSGKLITLLDGQVVLALPAERGSTHWQCVEFKGWLGFRNPVAGKCLGHNNNGTLRCAADRQQAWENFCVRLRPEGGYVLLMTHFERLWPLGTKMENGVEKLAKISGDASDGITWEFIEI
jgi:hypothetical protein